MRPGAGRKPAPASSALMRHSNAWPRSSTSSWAIGSSRTARDLDLRAHEVEAGDELGDRVLDLDARVHLEEEELAMAVEQALDRAGADVADRARGLDRHRSHARAQLGRDGRRGRLLEHLLVPALERAVALAEVDRARRGCRPAPGSRRGAGPRRTSRRRPRRRRSRPRPGAAPSRARARPRPPRRRPPSRAPAAGGGLDRDRPAVLVSELDHLRPHRGSPRSCPARSARRRPPCAAARRSWSPSPRSPPAAARSRPGRRPRRRGRRPRSRPGTRSPDGSPRRRSPARRR